MYQQGKKVTLLATLIFYNGIFCRKQQQLHTTKMSFRNSSSAKDSITPIGVTSPYKSNKSTSTTERKFQQSRSTCSSPPRPRRGFYITRPLPSLVVDDDYLYYIEYHCLPGLTMVSGANKSFCLTNGTWSGVIPTCEDIHGCRSGFKRASTGVCEDINECDRNNGGCQQICHNFVGGYVCKCLKGYGEQLSFPAICSDINECENGDQYCHHICINTPGSYHCGCTNGFVLLYDDETCIDVNECWPDGLGPCNQRCVNTYGSFQCSCNKGYHLSSDGVTCNVKCEPGFVPRNAIKPLLSDNHCIDINECNEIGSALCEGFCINLIGSYFCGCNQNETLSADGFSCIVKGFSNNLLNRLECGGNQPCINCPPNAVFNLADDHCICQAGYKGHPKLGIPCTEIDECNDSNYGCSHLCMNTDGGVYCKCPLGFALDTDGRTCRDVDECLVDNICFNSVCSNNIGSFNCICQEGYSLGQGNFPDCIEDYESCVPTKLLEHGRVLPSKFCNPSSTPKLGLVCMYACNPGYSLKGSKKRKCTSSGWNTETPICSITRYKCKPLKNPIHGQILPARLCLSNLFHRKEQVCIYTCNRGYQILGDRKVKCTSKGWSNTPPTCVAMDYCQPLERPNNTLIFPPTCYKQRNVYRQLCVYVCKNGFILKGNSTTRCGLNQTWERDSPECLKEGPVIPTIVCPPDLNFELQPGKSYVNVTVPSPVSNMNIIERRYSGVSAETVFPIGTSVVQFTALTDSRKRNVSCFVNVTVKDKIAPTVEWCPPSITTTSLAQFPNITWTEPLFSDNVGVVSVEMFQTPSDRMTWGIYQIKYSARDSSENIAECTFSITIKGISSTVDASRPLSRQTTLKTRTFGICQEGYELITTSNGIMSCKPCSRNTYRPPIDFIKSCIPCPGGFFQELPGQGFCKQCQANQPC